MYELIKYDNNKPSKEEKTWGMLCHLLSLTGIFIPLGIILGPLIMWLMKKNESYFVNKEGKAALNFQLTICIGLLCSVPLMLFGIGFIIAFVIIIFSIISSILGAIKANDGKHYDYMYTLNLIN